MVNSWDFINQLSSVQITELKRAILDCNNGYGSTIDTCNKDKISKLITSIEGDEDQSYFDYICFYCDKYHTTLNANVQKTEEALLYTILNSVLSKQNNVTCKTLSEKWSIPHGSKSDLLSTIKTRYRVSKAFRQSLIEKILDCSNSTLSSPILGKEVILLLKVIELRWDIIRPWSEEEAIDYVLHYLKRDENNLRNDNKLSIHILAYLVAKYKNITESELIQKVAHKSIKPIVSIPDIVISKLMPHVHLLIDMLMKRICQADENEIDLYIKVNDIVSKEGGSTLFVEYRFPYSIVNENCVYIVNEKYDLANRLYIAFKVSKPLRLIYIDNVNKSYDNVVCLSKEKAKYEHFGNLVIIDELYNQYLQYEELAAKVLPFFEMSLSEIQKKRTETHDAKAFDKLLFNLCDLKEKANLAMDSLAHLRHDHGSQLGVIHDYINFYSSADPQEKADANLAYKQVSTAIGYAGKEVPLETTDVQELIKKYINRNQISHKTYHVVYKGINHPVKVRINKDIFCSSVLGVIFDNAQRHGFIIERPVERNIIDIKITDSGDDWCITIKNNGERFKGNAEKVFEMNYIAGSTGHTGIGLNSLYQNICSFNGFVFFNSIPESEYPVVITIKLPKVNE